MSNQVKQDQKAQFIQGLKEAADQSVKDSSCGGASNQNQQNDANIKGLSKSRVTSSIPISDQTQRNATQDQISNFWQYPSQNMFFNAMKRKGWQPEERDIDIVVGIHNQVNEYAWRHILDWEYNLHPEVYKCGGPKLVKFGGRAQDITIKARILNLFGMDLPFDRHDWVVDRCGQQVSYVIDFYNLPQSPVGVHTDVRPSPSTFSNIYDRFRMTLLQFGGGGNYQNQPPSTARMKDFMHKQALEQVMQGEQNKKGG